MLAPTRSTMISSDEPRCRGFNQSRIEFPLSIGMLLARDSIVGIPTPKAFLRYPGVAQSHGLRKRYLTLEKLLANELHDLLLCLGLGLVHHIILDPVINDIQCPWSGNHNHLLINELVN